jgi:hypothetical protein
MSKRIVSTYDKALKLNLDQGKYGTFAETGAGQEVARWFFHVGGASSTIAKSISAYDMAMSDAIYGPARRYVSRERLVAMLDHEWRILVERLGPARGDRTKFFVFGDTVAARSFVHRDEGRGWLGIRFQTEAGGEPSQVMIHARLLDKVNTQQQETLGIAGVNLVHAATYLHHEPASLIDALLDDLTLERLNIDMLEFSGPAFDEVDNRLIALQLVERGYTEVAAFTSAGEAVPPSDLIHGKALLIDRGSFRPPTNATTDMLEGACAQFRNEPGVRDKDILVVMEMTLNNLLKTDTPAHRDFLDRVDILASLGRPVLISNFGEYHRLTSFLAHHTDEMIGIVMGVPTVKELFNEEYYHDLKGGIIESFGRLFKRGVKIYAYPFKDPATGEILTADNMPVARHLRHLRDHLLENGRIQSLQHVHETNLELSSEDVMSRIAGGDSSWETMVAGPVAARIKERSLFGYVATRPPVGDV